MVFLIPCSVLVLPVNSRAGGATRGRVIDVLPAVLRACDRAVCQLDGAVSMG